MWRVNPEVKARSVTNPGRDGHSKTTVYECLAGAVARQTALSPGFASSPALPARGAQEDIDRHDCASVRLLARQTHFGFHRLRALTGVLSEERLPDTRDEMADRWKIDRDLIRETIRIGLHAHAG